MSPNSGSDGKDYTEEGQESDRLTGGRGPRVCGS